MSDKDNGHSTISPSADVTNLPQVSTLRRHEERKAIVRRLQVDAYELRSQEDALHDQRIAVERQIRQEIAALHAEAAVLVALGAISS